MKTFTEEEIKETILKLVQSNKENGELDLYENPYICGIHDGLLDVLAGLQIDTDEDYVQ